MIRKCWSLCLLLLSPVASIADTVEHDNDWIGIWTAKPEWCVFADKVGRHNPAPIAISAVSLDGYENSCTITGVQQVGEMRAWNLRLLCQSEGSTYDEETLLALENDNILWRLYGAGEPIRFTRCEK